MINEAYFYWIKSMLIGNRYFPFESCMIGVLIYTDAFIVSWLFIDKEVVYSWARLR